MHFLDYPATFLLCGERRKYYQAFYSVIKYEKNCTFKQVIETVILIFIYKYLMKLSPACFLSILKETALLSRLFRYQSLLNPYLPKLGCTGCTATEGFFWKVSDFFNQRA